MPATLHNKLIITLLILQILIVMRNLESGFFSFLWYCDFTPGLLVIAFLMSDTQAVKGILNVGFFAQLGYTIIILTKIFFGITLFGFVFDFPFTATYVLPALIIHISTLVAFVAVYKERPTIISLIYSFFLLLAMYALVILLIKPSGNVVSNYNFIFHSNISTIFPYYTEMWIPLVFVFVVLPTHFFQYIIYRLQVR